MNSLWKKGILYALCIVLGVNSGTMGKICVNAENPVNKEIIPPGLESACNIKSLKKEKNGACGENITWTYNPKSKTLQFYGNGAMPDTEGGIYDEKNAEYERAWIGSWMVWRKKTKHLIIGEGITEIGEANFTYFNLKSISFPDTLTKIGEYALSDTFFDPPVSIVFPPSLKEIGHSAFASRWSSADDEKEWDEDENAGIVKVTLPDGLEKLGHNAFGSQPITKLVIPGTVQIEGAVGNIKLKKLILKSGIEKIPFQMCSFCPNLETIEIPDTVKEIGKEAFWGCKKLKNIKIPNSVTYIGASAFKETTLTKITIPDSVETLEQDVFLECFKLKQVTLPAHLTELKSGLFMNCKKLENVKIPKKVTSVTLSAFWGTSVTKIVLPKNVTSLKKDVDPYAEDITGWRKARMVKLKQIVIQSTKLERVSKKSFSGIKKTCVIKVPKRKVKKYKKMIYKSGVDKKVKIRAITKHK